MKQFKIITAIVILVLLTGSSSVFGAAGQEDLLKRLDELGAILEQQQKEIEKLRQELRNQQESGRHVREKQVGDDRETASAPAEAEKKEASLKDKFPEWTKKIKISGDLRLRYEGLYNRDQQQADGSSKDLPNRDRYRIRARLFFDGKISDEVSTHFMICTNQDKNQEATTTNQSFSNDFNDKGIYLHRAYATYTPKWLDGLELTAGKFKNTFMHTDIMWDPDVNQEGVYERYQYRGWEAFQPFVHLGQMAVNEENLQSDDAALFIYQGGFDWRIGPVKWTLAGSYYDWTNLHNTEYLHLADYKGGGGNTYYKDAAGHLQYQYDYKLLQAITHVSFKLGTVPTRLIFDYVKNTADNVPEDQDTAYFAGFTLGASKKKGDMSLAYKYARIERDALIGSMNDQDFYGANRKGHKVTFSSMLLDRLRFQTAYFYTDPVTDWVPNSANWANERARMHEDRLQGDLIFKF